MAVLVKARETKDGGLDTAPCNNKILTYLSTSLSTTSTNRAMGARHWREFVGIRDTKTKQISAPRTVGLASLVLSCRSYLYLIRMMFPIAARARRNEAGRLSD